MLLMRGVADSDWRRPLIAGEPWQLELGQPPLARKAVHDLERRRRSSYCVHQPLAPGTRFFCVAARHQGVEGEGGVAKPTVAIVPIAHPPNEFWKRGGCRSDDPTSGCIRQSLEGDERADDCIMPLPSECAAT